MIYLCRFKKLMEFFLDFPLYLNFRNYRRMVMRGERFGWWTVIREAPRNAKYERVMMCSCSCGTVRLVRLYFLERGSSKSCGCKRGQLVAHHNTTHGMSRDRTYNTWSAMIQRCTNPNHSAYHNYGGRGVTVCESWRASFENFLQDMGVRPYGLELDRRDNSLGYSKGNCRWVTTKTNMSNSRVSKWWWVNGNRYASCTEAASAEGVDKQCILRWCNGYKRGRNGKKFPPRLGCYSELKYQEKQEC